MARQIQLRRGTTAEHATFTGVVGEVTIDTDKDTVVVHDGSTAGGFPLATASDLTNFDADTLDGKHLATIESEYQTFANNAAAAVVDSAPATLDTLNELAAALGDDPNFATTVTNSIATKMPLAGGTFTGDVAYGDNVKATFGVGSDLQIYHDGSNSYIDDAGTGDLRIRADNLLLKNFSGEDYITAVSNGSVSISYDNAIKLATSSTGIDVTGTAVTDGVTVDGTLDIEEVFEKVAIATSTSGNINYDFLGQGVVFFSNNQSANRTINFIGDGSNTFNSILDIGQSATCSVLMSQGSTAYYINAYQVDGSAVTPKWSGGSAPTEGNASGIDVYTFTIIKTANATFTVLASITDFA